MRDTQKTTEDYLEAMLMMKEKRGFIRSVDVANHLGVTKPSVSYATRRLREAGYIEMDKDSFITLTPSGTEIAERTYTRHKVLTEFFTGLGVDPAIAREDACKVEHDLSPETFAALCLFAQNNKL